MTWLRCPIKIHDSTTTVKENIVFMASSYYSSSDDGNSSESDFTSNRSSRKSNKYKQKRRYSFCASDIGKIEGLESLSERRHPDSKSDSKHEEEK
jgi:hypothetical protein